METTVVQIPQTSENTSKKINIARKQVDATSFESSALMWITEKLVHHYKYLGFYDPIVAFNKQIIYPGSAILIKLPFIDNTNEISHFLVTTLGSLAVMLFLEEHGETNPLDLENEFKNVANLSSVISGLHRHGLIFSFPSHVILSDPGRNVLGKLNQK